jgi:hypothetical protein
VVAVAVNVMAVVVNMVAMDVVAAGAAVMCVVRRIAVADGPGWRRFLEEDFFNVVKNVCREPRQAAHDKVPFAMRIVVVQSLLGMDSVVWKSELSVFVSASYANMDIRIRIRFQYGCQMDVFEPIFNIIRTRHYPNYPKHKIKYP